MAKIKLSEKLIFTGTITLKTGLHIGGTNTAMNIGGPDKFVVRNPLTNIPYIPGSSLKGKMRLLIELKDGSADEKGDPTKEMSTRAGALFGTAPIKKDAPSHPSRIIVRDSEMNLALTPNFENTDMPFSESKTEVSVNRITAKANPRTIERVPAGAVFNVNLILNIFESDDKKQLLETLKDALCLLEDDYLGGNGSRGYGQIQFSDEFMEQIDKRIAEVQNTETLTNDETD